MNALFRLLFPSIIWRKESTDKVIYLTFDDGPIPEVTPWVLDTLQDYNANATFFCLGANAFKHSAILQRIRKEGHSIGNHTMHHLNGWKTSDEVYISDTAECNTILNATLFRPPYGRIKPSQLRKLRARYTVVMWDVLCKDYDPSLTGDDCLNRIKRKTRNGSILVFHDSLKAEKNLRQVLPETLKYYSNIGFKFHAL